MERSVEMVQAKVIAFVLLALSAGACTPRISWTKHDMDGHRTGVTAPNADNVAEALGAVNDSCYVSPGGEVFLAGSATYAAASELIAVQPEMAALKQVIGYSSEDMLRGGPNCALSNWIVDHLMEDVGRLTGRRVDVGIINSGGIRVDLPAGPVIMDDLVSMLPFKNYLCYVGLKGRDLKALFEYMAADELQPFGGARVVVDGHRIDSLLVGGVEVDPEKVYGVATIDFLLDGGDRISIGRNACELIITDVKVIDSMLPYAMGYAERGDTIKYFTDDRLVVRGGK